MKHLPRKPSRLIRLALKDLRAREADSRYKIDMTAWHSPSPWTEPKCSVCLAGCVMGRLGADPRTYLTPSHFDNNANKLRSLDHFRIGLVGDALETLGVKRPKGIRRYTNIPAYEHNPKTFHRAMGRLADRLEKAGL